MKGLRAVFVHLIWMVASNDYMQSCNTTLLLHHSNRSITILANNCNPPPNVQLWHYQLLLGYAEELEGGDHALQEPAVGVHMVLQPSKKLTLRLPLAVCCCVAVGCCFGYQLTPLPPTPQLVAFSETQQADALVSSGKAAAAQSLLQRVVDICCAATGPTSALAQAARNRCCNNACVCMHVCRTHTLTRWFVAGLVLWLCGRLAEAHLAAGNWAGAASVRGEMLAQLPPQHGQAGADEGRLQLALLEQSYRLHLHLGRPAAAEPLCDRAASVAEVRGVCLIVVAYIMRSRPYTHTVH